MFAHGEARPCESTPETTDNRDEPSTSQREDADERWMISKRMMCALMLGSIDLVLAAHSISVSSTLRLRRRVHAEGGGFDCDGEHVADQIGRRECATWDRGGIGRVRSVWL